MSCCNHRCNKGRSCHCRAISSLVRSARIVLSYAIVLLVLMAIASTAFIAMHQTVPFTTTEIAP